MRSAFLSALALYLLLTTGVLQAVAQDADLPAESEVPVVSAADASPAAVQLPVDLKMAASIAVEAFGGEVLKADEVEDSSGLRFHIRVVNEGRVRDVVIDAANGDILNPAEDT